MVADSHVDATTDIFSDTFGEEVRRPEWLVTSPPHKHAFAILKRALRVGRGGVAFKLRLTFLESTKSRGQWLKDKRRTAVENVGSRRRGLYGKVAGWTRKAVVLRFFLRCPRKSRRLHSVSAGRAGPPRLDGVGCLRQD